MGKELKIEIQQAFERVFSRSLYIAGVEDKAFEESFAEYCRAEY